MKWRLRDRYDDFLRRLLNCIVDGRKFDFKDNPYLLFIKKYYCPICGKLLVRKLGSVIISSNSEEAKDYDFSNFDTYMKGNIKFYHMEFVCSGCGKVFRLEELKG